jgi:hypothetical protein
VTGLSLDKLQDLQTLHDDCSRAGDNNRFRVYINSCIAASR